MLLQVVLLLRVLAFCVLLKVVLRMVLVRWVVVARLRVRMMMILWRRQRRVREVGKGVSLLCCHCLLLLMGRATATKMDSHPSCLPLRGSILLAVGC